MDLIRDYFRDTKELSFEQYKVLDSLRFMKFKYESRYDELKNIYKKKAGRMDPEELEQLDRQIAAKEAQLELFDDIFRNCFNR